MKFVTLLVLPVLAFVSSAVAASAFIAEPASGSDVVRGSNVTIQVAMPVRRLRVYYHFHASTNSQLHFPF